MMGRGCVTAAAAAASVAIGMVTGARRTTAIQLASQRGIRVVVFVVELVMLGVPAGCGGS